MALRACIDMLQVEAPIDIPLKTPEEPPGSSMRINSFVFLKVRLEQLTAV